MALYMLCWSNSRARTISKLCAHAPLGTRSRYVYSSVNLASFQGTSEWAPRYTEKGQVDEGRLKIFSFVAVPRHGLRTFTLHFTISLSVRQLTLFEASEGWRSPFGRVYTGELNRTRLAAQGHSPHRESLYR